MGVTFSTQRTGPQWGCRQRGPIETLNFLKGK